MKKIFSALIFGILRFGTANQCSDTKLFRNYFLSPRKELEKNAFGL